MAALWRLALSVGSAMAAPKPHILFILQDDMGWWNAAIHNNEDQLVADSTAHLTSLAREGVVLTNHYVH